MEDEATAPDDHFELIGQVVDDQKITIKSVVGVGGFSVVYEGWHHVFEERVAIKCLKVPGGYSKAQVREYLTKFRREGQLLLKLSRSTQNVVRILNMGEIQANAGMSVPYLVLEWLEGEGLDAWIERRRLSGAHRLSLAETTMLLDSGAEALAKAHSMGVAHRDVKPPNFLVTADAHSRYSVKLIDFGIAKQFDVSAPSSRLETQVSTSPAYTPSYGAPEQFARDFERTRLGIPATGPHTDVFSLALVCVELLAGVAPLGDDDNRLALYHEATRRDRRPTPRTRGADVPDEVELVFVRALAVDVESRYAGVVDFWQALHSAAGLPVPSWVAHAEVPASGRKANPTPSVPMPAPVTPSLPAQRHTVIDVAVPPVIPAGPRKAPSSPTARNFGAILVMLVVVGGALVVYLRVSATPTAVGKAPVVSSVPTSSTNVVRPPASSPPVLPASVPAAAIASWTCKDDSDCSDAGKLAHCYQKKSTCVECYDAYGGGNALKSAPCLGADEVCRNYQCDR